MRDGKFPKMEEILKMWLFLFISIKKLIYFNLWENEVNFYILI